MIKQFTGIDDPYEQPENPEIVIETDKMSLERSVEEILTFLEAKRLIY
jgi:adenylylsulfate kinase